MSFIDLPSVSIDRASFSSQETSFEVDSTERRKLIYLILDIII